MRFSLITVTTLLLAATFSTAAISNPGLDPDLLAGLEARAIGPAAVGGRIAAIDVVNHDPRHMVIGAATGGVWITHNGGLTWDPVFDDQPVASIGAVAINQQNPDIIWVGTGEGNTRNSTSIGGGLYKSIDGGQSWQLMGLANSERINRIALHPTNQAIAYVAALGTLWGPNTERGIYKTTDGGVSWENILFVDETTGGTDVKMDPANPDKLIASMWQFRRWPYYFNSGGPGSGLYLSHDGGASWTRKTEEDGLPKGKLGRITSSFSAADSSRVYALVEAENSALLRSDDGGDSWVAVNEEYNVADRPFYYSEIIADPQNPDRVYNMATRLRVSIDGGKNFAYNPVIDCCAPGNTIHIDSHAFWINPADPQHLVIGNDGGIAISRDRGETWRFVRNLPLAQFYHVRVDNETPYNIYGGLQDNGSWRGPSEVRVPGGIRNLHWREVGFGDGFDTIPDPQNAQAGYAMSQGGYLSRYDLDTGEMRMVRPAPPADGTQLRFNWNAGFSLDPFEPGTIYYGSQFVHKSTDRGDSWSIISGDLTSNDPVGLKSRESGGLTPDVTAAENYTSIVALAASELERGILWVGTDDGRVHVTRDGGGNWTRIDQQRGVPEGAWIAMIAPSPHEAGTAFVAVDDHRRSDMAPYLFRVENFGQRWTRLGPDGLSGYALSILQDPVDPDLLFAGTEFGLFLSTNAGQEWIPFRAGVPTVSVMDMAIQQRETDLVLGTHGRSIFVIDDYSVLRNLDDDDLAARLAVKSASTGLHYMEGPTASTRFTGSGEYRGPNEPYGVAVTFLASGTDLPHPDEDKDRQRRIEQRQNAPENDSQNDSGDDDEAAKDPKVKVTVYSSTGEALRHFTHPVQQGINRLYWDMSTDGVRPAPGPEAPDPEADLPAGPEVPPGDYRVVVELDDVSDSIDVNTALDPRVNVSQQALEARFAAMLQIQAMQEQAVSALERIDRARKDIVTIQGLIAQQPDPEALAALKESASNATKSLNALEKVFRVPPETKGINYDDDKVMTRIGLAGWYVGSAFQAPSPTAETYMRDAEASLDKGITQLNSYLTGELAALRKAVRDAQIELLQAEPL